jgi:hypothetical protein
MDSSIAPAELAIHDVLLTPLAPAAAGRQALLAFEDHLLRRFGSLELVRLDPGDTFGVSRRVADEVWILLDGAVHVSLEDTRPSSPTFGSTATMRLQPHHRLLVPFGVRLGARAEAATSLLRLMTHSEREDPPAAEGA